MAKKTEMQIRWKSGSRFRESAVPVEKAYTEICKIKDQNGGRHITAEDLVHYAEFHTKSAIYKLIGTDDGWDDKKCAHRYRVAKAGSILRSIEVKYTEKQKDAVRAFSVDASSWKKDKSRYKPYRPTNDILADDVSRASFLQSALNELVSFQRRYRALNELAVIIREIDTFLDNYHASNV